MSVFSSDVTEPTTVNLNLSDLDFVLQIVRFGFVTQSQLVQFSQVKNAKFCLKFKDVHWTYTLYFFVFIFVFLCIIILLIIYCNSSLRTDIGKHALSK